MARKKNCDKRRQENLLKLPPKKPVVSRRPTVEDVRDSENESDDDFAPEDSVTSSDDDSEFDMESDDEDNILMEIRTDAELLVFASRLQKAHDQMVNDEKAQCATKKRKATYPGNSVRSKRRWRAEGKKTEAAGFPSVMKYFQKQPDKENPAINSGISVEVSKPKKLNAKQLIEWVNRKMRKTFQTLEITATHLRIQISSWKQGRGQGNLLQQLPAMMKIQKIQILQL
jgi:hypothetical protein